MRTVLLASLLTLAAAPALAGVPCGIGAGEEWMHREAVERLVQEIGYDIEEFMLVVEDGCLEARLIHEGARIEIRFEPVTGEIMQIKQG
ncbi:PepSY domain-containing protein [Limimaricola sp.]|uniref:PepSY domain-containing protein n=1 Tax=Limimaricola sp. TaxID=2211665 RepID=UPI004059E279